jgi:predicted dehydrogenase
MRFQTSVDRRSLLTTFGAISFGIAGRHANAFGPERRKIRVGQIGVRHAHASKLAVYRQSPDYEVVGIVEPDDRSRQAAQAHPAYRDLPWMTQDQLLNTPGLDAVLVETRVRDSLDAAQACVAAGKHVHLDKPAGESLAQYGRIINAAKRQRLMVQMGYMYRYSPAVRLLKDFLARGLLGEIFEVHTVMSKSTPSDERTALAEYRGGMMFELGCHVLDLVIGVLGEPETVSSFAQQAHFDGDSLLDNMLAVLKYPRAIATVKSSGLEIEGFARRHFVVCGTSGTFHIQPLDAPAARIALSQPFEGFQKGYQEKTFPQFTRYVADAADMAQVIRGEKEPDYSYDHDLAVQRTLLKACQMPLDG